MASISLHSPPLAVASPHPPNRNTSDDLTSRTPNSNLHLSSPIHSKPSTARYNSLIRTHLDSRRPKQALSLFRRLFLSDHPLPPDNFTFPLVLKACAHLCDLQLARQIHCLVLKSHAHTDDVFINTSLLNAYGDCGEIEDARNVFGGMPERNIVTWNSMIAAFVKCGDVDAAVECFAEMPDRNVVSWNSLLAGYVKAGMPHEALVLFPEMWGSGLLPDESTMVSLVSAISDLGLLDLGRRAHGYIARSEISLNGALGVALITMYSRCGSIDSAYRVFLMISVKNVGHWTSMIGGLANHGLTEDSLGVFSDMLHLGVRPNHITFIGVLNACRHAGLADEGLKYFNLMRNFNVEPRIEHYGCLVDLLGRCGRVEEALAVASNLPTDPGVEVWGSLLAACVNHVNVEVAEVVARKLIERRPEGASYYVMLSNLYAKVGRWEDFSRMRRRMGRRAEKVAGFSWIEVNGRVHEFVAGDQFHARAKEVYSILEEMRWSLKNAGYEPVVLESSEGAVGGAEDSSVEYRDE